MIVYGALEYVLSHCFYPSFIWGILEPYLSPRVRKYSFFSKSSRDLFHLIHMPRNIFDSQIYFECQRSTFLLNNTTFTQNTLLQLPLQLPLQFEPQL